MMFSFPGGYSTSTGKDNPRRPSPDARCLVLSSRFAARGTRYAVSEADDSPSLKLLWAKEDEATSRQLELHLI